MVIPALCALMLNTVACAQDQSTSSSNDIPFPNAQKGYDRHVIYLPHIENEQDAKVELLIGKTMNVDCNQHNLSGEVEKTELEGWGYDYFVVKNIGPVVSTLMACSNVDPAVSSKMPSENGHKSEKFITLNGIDLQRYNSQLPLIVYTPKDIEVRYRIWHASKEISTAVINNKGKLPYTK